MFARIFPSNREVWRDAVPPRKPSFRPNREVWRDVVPPRKPSFRPVWAAGYPLGAAHTGRNESNLGAARPPPDPHCVNAVYKRFLMPHLRWMLLLVLLVVLTACDVRLPATSAGTSTTPVELNIFAAA